MDRDSSCVQQKEKILLKKFFQIETETLNKQFKQLINRGFGNNLHRKIMLKSKNKKEEPIEDD